MKRGDLVKKTITVSWEGETQTTTLVGNVVSMEKINVKKLTKDGIETKESSSYNVYFDPIISDDNLDFLILAQKTPMFKYIFSFGLSIEDGIETIYGAEVF